MKKKVICLFSLILYLLAACTLLSGKIEEEMATLVQVDFRKAAGSFVPTSQSMDSLFTDEAGQHLYQVVDGIGWESGLRIREIPEGVWSLAYARNVYVEVPGGENYQFITSASRQPPEGRLAKIVEEFETGKDQYLLIAPSGLPENPALPEYAKLAARNECAMVVDMEKASFPFFPRNASALFPEASGAEIFSLTEVEQFLNQLPAATLIAAALAMGVFLWAFSCCLSIRAWENRILLCFNAVLMAVSLIFLQALLKHVDFPASLLPAENILEWKHYTREFHLIFDALEGLEMRNILNLKDTFFTQCLAVIRSGGLLTAAVIAIETLIIVIRTLLGKRRHYVGKYLRPRRK